VGDEPTFHCYHFGKGVRRGSCLHCVAAHENGEEEEEEEEEEKEKEEKEKEEEEREAYILNDVSSAELKVGTWYILL
jgi:hypothetical protein